MAHHIHQDDNFGYVGQRAWHGLGKEIPEGLSAVEAFPQVGLGWDTELAPIYAKVNVDGETREVPLLEHMAHMRMDTLDPLGVVSDNYAQITNMDLAQFVDQLAGEDAAVTVDTAGSLYNGRRVFTLVKLPTTIKVGADVSETYVLVSNGHGGFASFSCYPTSIRVVCDNTLRWSERDAAKGITFRHTGDLDTKVQQARNALGLALKEAEKFKEQVLRLCATDLSAGQVRDFMLMAYEATYGALPDPKKDPEAFEKLRDKRDKEVEAWVANMDDERQRVRGTEGSLWAGLNAITQWHDHERGRFKGIKESGARVHSNLFGASNRDKQRALRAALEFAGA